MAPNPMQIPPMTPPPPMGQPPMGGMPPPPPMQPPMGMQPPAPPQGGSAQGAPMGMNVDPMARQNFNSMISGIQNQSMIPPMPMHMAHGGQVPYGVRGFQEGGSTNPLIALLQGLGRLFGFGGGQDQESSGTLDDFNRAFAAARRAGKKTFSFDRDGDGVTELYTTQLEGEVEGTNEQGAESELDRSKARFFKEQGIDPRIGMNMSGSMPKSDSVAELLNQAEGRGREQTPSLRYEDYFPEIKAKEPWDTSVPDFVLNQVMDEMVQERRRIGGPEDFVPYPMPEARGMDPRLNRAMDFDPALSLKRSIDDLENMKYAQVGAYPDSFQQQVLGLDNRSDLGTSPKSVDPIAVDPIEAELNALISQMTPEMAPGDVRETVSRTDALAPLPQLSMLDQFRARLDEGSSSVSWLRDRINNLLKNQEDRQEKINAIQRDFNLLEDGKLGQFGIGMNQGGVVPVQGYDNGGGVMDFFSSLGGETVSPSKPFFTDEELKGIQEQLSNPQEGVNMKGYTPLEQAHGYFDAGGTDTGYGNIFSLDDWKTTLKGGDPGNQYLRQAYNEQDNIPYSPTPFKQSDAEERRDKAAKAYRDQVVGKGHDYFGTPGDRDLEAWAFGSEDVAGNPDHPNYNIYSQKLYTDGDLVGFTDPDTGKFRPLTYNHAQQAKQMGIVDVEPTSEEEVVAPDITNYSDYDYNSGQNNNVTNNVVAPTPVTTPLVTPSAFDLIKEATVVPSTSPEVTGTFSPLSSADIYDPTFLTNLGLPDPTTIGLNPSESSAIDLQKFLEMDTDSVLPKPYVPEKSFSEILKANQGGAVPANLNMAIDKFLTAFS